MKSIRVKKYTISEVKAWLAGNLLAEYGLRISEMKENLALEIALSLIDDKDSGIEAWLKSKE